MSIVSFLTHCFTSPSIVEENVKNKITKNELHESIIYNELSITKKDIKDNIYLDDGFTRCVEKIISISFTHSITEVGIILKSLEIINELEENINENQNIINKVPIVCNNNYQQDYYVGIRSIIPYSKADKEKLKLNAYLIAINDVSTRGLSYEKVIYILKDSTTTNNKEMETTVTFMQKEIELQIDRNPFAITTFPHPEGNRLPGLVPLIMNHSDTSIDNNDIPIIRSSLFLDPLVENAVNNEELDHEKEQKNTNFENFIYEYQRPDTNNIYKQYWMSDRSAKTCYDCEKYFTFYRRRHHCRSCGQIFCGQCCSRLNQYVTSSTETNSTIENELDGKEWNLGWLEKQLICNFCNNQLFGDSKNNINNLVIASSSTLASISTNNLNPLSSSTTLPFTNQNTSIISTSTNDNFNTIPDFFFIPENLNMFFVNKINIPKKKYYRCIIIRDSESLNNTSENDNEDYLVTDQYEKKKIRLLYGFFPRVQLLVNIHNKPEDDLNHTAQTESAVKNSNNAIKFQKNKRRRTSSEPALTTSFSSFMYQLKSETNNKNEAVLTKNNKCNDDLVMTVQHRRRSSRLTDLLSQFTEEDTSGSTLFNKSWIEKNFFSTYFSNIRRKKKDLKVNKNKKREVINNKIFNLSNEPSNELISISRKNSNTDEFLYSSKSFFDFTSSSPNPYLSKNVIQNKEPQQNKSFIDILYSSSSPYYPININSFSTISMSSLTGNQYHNIRPLTSPVDEEFQSRYPTPLYSNDHNRNHFLSPTNSIDLNNYSQNDSSNSRNLNSDGSKKVVMKDNENMINDYKIENDENTNFPIDIKEEEKNNIKKVMSIDADNKIKDYLLRSFCIIHDTVNNNNVLHYLTNSEKYEWIQIIENFLKESITDFYIPNLFNPSDNSMNVLDYIKIVLFPQNSKYESYYINGVLHKNKSISRKVQIEHCSNSNEINIENPRILLIGSSLEYQREKRHILSLENIAVQETEYMHIIVSKISKLQPNIIIFNGPVHHLAEDLFYKQKIIIIKNINNNKMMNRIAYFTNATVLVTPDHVDKLPFNNIIGTCKKFEIIKTLNVNYNNIKNKLKKSVHHSADVITPKNIRKQKKTINNIIFSGCSLYKGGTLVLYGENLFILKNIKKIIKNALLLAYNMKLQISYLSDLFLVPVEKNVITNINNDRFSQICQDRFKNQSLSLYSSFPTGSLSLETLSRKIRTKQLCKRCLDNYNNYHVNNDINNENRNQNDEISSNEVSQTHRKSEPAIPILFNNNNDSSTNCVCNSINDINNKLVFSFCWSHLSKSKSSSGSELMCINYYNNGPTTNKSDMTLGQFLMKYCFDNNKTDTFNNTNNLNMNIVSDTNIQMNITNITNNNNGYNYKRAFRDHKLSFSHDTGRVILTVKDISQSQRAPDENVFGQLLTNSAVINKESEINIANQITDLRPQDKSNNISVKKQKLITNGSNDNGNPYDLIQPSDHILMWTACKTTKKRASSVTIMSKDTRNYSFGQFLSDFFYGNKRNELKINVTCCPHLSDLGDSGDSTMFFRYFSYKGKVTKFSYEIVKPISKIYLSPILWRFQDSNEKTNQSTNLDDCDMEEVIGLARKIRDITINKIIKSQKDPVTPALHTQNILKILRHETNHWFTHFIHRLVLFSLSSSNRYINYDIYDNTSMVVFEKNLLIREIYLRGADWSKRICQAMQATVKLISNSNIYNNIVSPKTQLPRSWFGPLDDSNNAIKMADTGTNIQNHDYMNTNANLGSLASIAKSIAAGEYPTTENKITSNNLKDEDKDIPINSNRIDHSEISDKYNKNNIQSNNNNSNIENDCGYFDIPKDLLCWHAGLPPGFNNNIVLVNLSQPTSVIAYSLNTKDYYKKLKKILNSCGDHTHSINLLTNPISTNMDITFVDDNSFQSLVKFNCKIYFAMQFHALRQVHYNNDSNDNENCLYSDNNFIASLCRCEIWDAAGGGKSGAGFMKTEDQRYIAKLIPLIELQMFLNTAAEYFSYMESIFKKKIPSLLSKVLGIYKITITTNEKDSSGENVFCILIMENLLYGHEDDIDYIFDLKGKMDGRYKRTNSNNNVEVLWDKNFIKMIEGIPLSVSENSFCLLLSAVINDTKYLANIEITDYSMLIGYCKKTQTIIACIIDYIHQYNLMKMVEHAGKRLIQEEREITVLNPKQYKKRFRLAFLKYFTIIPSLYTIVIPNTSGYTISNVSNNGNK